MINEIQVRPLTWDEHVDFLEWQEKTKKEHPDMTQIRFVMEQYYYIFQTCYGAPAGCTPAEIMAIGNLTLACTSKVRDSERKNLNSSGNGSATEPLIAKTAEKSKAKRK